MSPHLDKVRAIVRDNIGERATSSADTDTLDQLGADSLDVVEIEMACEDQCGFRFSEGDGLRGDMTTLEIAEAVDDRLARGKEAVTL